MEVRVLFRALSVDNQRVPTLKSLGIFCWGLAGVPKVCLILRRSGKLGTFPSLYSVLCNSGPTPKCATPIYASPRQLCPTVPETRQATPASGNRQCPKANGAQLASWFKSHVRSGDTWEPFCTAELPEPLSFCGAFARCRVPAIGCQRAVEGSRGDQIAPKLSSGWAVFLAIFAHIRLRNEHNAIWCS